MEHPYLPELLVECVEASIAEFDRQTKLVERRIDEIVASDAELSQSVELLSSIPGVAKKAALVLLAETAPVETYDGASDLAAGFGLHP